jgi:hypothetical protein
MALRRKVGENEELESLSSKRIRAQKTAAFTAANTGGGRMSAA